MQKLCITPQDGHHYFFGYYDLQPFSSDGKRHLCHRVPFFDRMPTAEDICEIGYLSVEDAVFHRIGETRAWCFQQGALLSWFDRDESVIFNDFDGEKNIARVLDMQGRELRRYDRAIATFHREKGVALSMNFSRVYDFRPGYGYSNVPDAKASVNNPTDDGIFFTDLEGGATKLLVSYAELAKKLEEKPYTDCKMVVNHINLDPTGTRYVILYRNFYAESTQWKTMLAAGDLAGNVWPLSPFMYNSHYHFRDENNLLIYQEYPATEENKDKRKGLFLVDIGTGKAERLDHPISDHNDIHCLYAPDRSFVIGDSYPNAQRERMLYYHNFKTNTSGELFRVHSEPANPGDVRCDLHARVHTDNKTISYDTTENLRREVMLVTLEDGDIG